MDLSGRIFEIEKLSKKLSNHPKFDELFEEKWKTFFVDLFYFLSIHTASK